jgi:hypothetical protein
VNNETLLTNDQKKKEAEYRENFIFNYFEGNKIE